MPKDFKKRPHRLVAVLKKLYTSSDGLTTKELSDIADISVRMAEKDFRVLSEVYPHNLIKENGKYRLDLDCPTQMKRQVALRLQNRMVVKLALDLLEHGADLSQFRDDVIDELELEKLMIPYYIQPEYYETIDIDSPLVETLTELIHHDYQADILFRDEAYRVEPYKLANFDGIWYLYAKDLQDNKLKTWALREIEEASKTQLHHKYTKDDTLIENELDTFHSAHFIHGKEIEVVIKVDSEAAYLFEARDYVKDQKILKALDDGSMLVGFIVSSYQDIDNIVKSHLPHIEIVEPLEFRDKFVSELKSYMKKVEIANPTSS